MEKEKIYKEIMYNYFDSFDNQTASKNKEELNIAFNIKKEEDESYKQGLIDATKVVPRLIAVGMISKCFSFIKECTNLSTEDIKNIVSNM